MTASAVAGLMGQMFWTAFWVSLPLLAIGFVVGVALSLVQIVTSMQDASFSAVPRLAAFLGGLLLFLPYMLQKLVSYTASLFGDFSSYAR